MERYIIDKLKEWKVSKRRKPLILRGARQVGKTYIVKEFGNAFEDGIVYINFEKEEEFSLIFERNLNIKRIVEEIEISKGIKITKNTLIFFDEIQACNKALNSLKYFCEDGKEYCIIAAGSLLGLHLNEGFPVGKVDFLDMYPLSFKEFLLANSDDNLLNYLNNINNIDNVSALLSNKFIERLKTYLIIGGMPEAVKNWIEDHDFKLIDNSLLDILESYSSDFAKHASNTDYPRIKYIYNSLPSQLAKENKKFLYSVVKPGARAREYENALNWLIDASIVNKVSKITKPGLPLSSYEDLTSFKIYMNDCGLLRKHSYLSSSIFLSENLLFSEFKGALTENFVLESLRNIYNSKVYYWSDVNNEVDFIIQKENLIIPIEVKSNTNVRSRSLKIYLEKYNNITPLAIRYSLKNLSLDGNILNIPLYLIDETDKLIDLALSKLNVAY